MDRCGPGAFHRAERDDGIMETIEGAGYLAEEPLELVTWRSNGPRRARFRRWSHDTTVRTADHVKGASPDGRLRRTRAVIPETFGD